jgi:hypothetical protein
LDFNYQLSHWSALAVSNGLHNSLLHPILEFQSFFFAVILWHVNIPG